MSDNYFVIVPKDPQYIPDRESQRRVAALARALAPAADEIATDEFETIRFFDSGANFEHVICPHCDESLPLEWWQDQMSADFDGQGFRLASVVLPCCGAAATLNEIRYDWPQAFGRFSCTMRNPRLADLPESSIKALETTLGGPVSVVRSHT